MQGPVAVEVKVGEKQKNWSTTPSHIVHHFGTSGLAVAVATAVTHPLARNADVLKVRLQMQFVGQKGPLNGMGRLFLQILKKEGPKSLYLGLTPALTRSILYGGLRLGLYEPSKYACDWAFGSTNILVKIASGAFAGATATALTNPTEVLKVRLQMNSSMKQSGSIAEMRRLISEEGIRALWKGVGPAMARAAALTASQLATYDESKRILIRWTPLEEGFHLHLISSAVAGTMSTLITAPVDMVKTRLMLQRESRKVGSYKNGFHCAYQSLDSNVTAGIKISELSVSHGCWATQLKTVFSQRLQSFDRDNTSLTKLQISGTTTLHGSLVTGYYCSLPAVN
ncbi:mitochondrial substrate carrier family protein [Citrus sinensis]|uniref:Mitochondrial substrate carrier family protein n=1 Tax=Citrus sinensis TaxID=2711 RepID=A0ACB8MJQ7_CITSI|nr:mitochondrial substrate carrier family protein [Citrus sinensis]